MALISQITTKKILLISKHEAERDLEHDFIIEQLGGFVNRYYLIFL